MFFHKCGQPIMIKMARSYYGQPSITQQKIRLITIVSESEDDEKKILYCQKCKEEITEQKLNDLLGYCSYCKTTKPITELFVPSKTGGIYCEEHLKEFYSDEKYNTLLDVAKKIS